MTENKTFIHFYTIKIFTVNDNKNEVYKHLKLSESKKKGICTRATQFVIPKCKALEILSNCQSPHTH